MVCPVLAADGSVTTVRLYVDHPLGAGQTVPLSRAQAHYLFTVMRLRRGGHVTVFNGRDGAWQAEITQAARNAGALDCVEMVAPQGHPPDLWLLFAPIKKARTDFIVEKATEMGVRRILPVRTDFTNSERLRRDRLQAHAIEAAEQCGGTFVPELCELTPLSDVLQGWDPARRLMFCDETRAGTHDPLPRMEPGAAPDPWAVLIGPEGGFSPAERARLAALDVAQPVALGPRVLRADTAAVAALTLWQITFGDWR